MNKILPISLIIALLTIASRVMPLSVLLIAFTVGTVLTIIHTVIARRLQR